MGSEAGHLAVVAYLYTEGEADADMAEVVAALPKKPGDKRHMEAPEIAIEKLKPLQRDFYTYPGSLTTPPCSEGVRWLVAAEPLTLSAEQLEAFDAVLHNNNRPVQPRHVRTLLLVKTPRE
jgi:carbonic anhydrase